MNQFIKFIWWIPTLDCSCKIRQYLLKDIVNQRTYLLPNVSNILVTGTDKAVEQLQKYNISSSFHQKLARCCNFPIKKQRTKGAPGCTNFWILFVEFQIWIEAVKSSNVYSQISWIKEFTFCQIFQIFLLLEPIKQYKNCINVIFQVIFIKNWQGLVTSQLRNKGGKGIVDEPISKFYLMNVKSEAKLWDESITFHTQGKSKSLLLAQLFQYSVTGSDKSIATAKMQYCE